MNRLKKRIDQMNRREDFIKRRSRSHFYYVVAAAIIVFIASYAMILPAISMDRKTSDKMDGIRLEGGKINGRGRGTLYGNAEPENGIEDGKDNGGSQDSADPEDKNDSQNPEGGKDNGGSPDSTESKDKKDSQDPESGKSDTGITDSTDSKDKNDSRNPEDGEEKVDSQNPEEGNENEDGLNPRDNDEKDKPEDNTAGDEDGRDKQEDTQGQEGSWLTGTFTLKGDDYEVQVTVGEDARIPVDARFYVKKVRDVKKYKELARKNLGIKDFSKSRFFDMGFARGQEEVEPAAPVQVNFSLKEEIDAQLIHFTDSGVEIVKTAEPVLLSDTDVPMTDWDDKSSESPETRSLWKIIKAFISYIFHKRLVPDPNGTNGPGEDDYKTNLQFQTDSFSVFAIVKKVYKDQVLAFSGEDYQVTVACPAGARISEKARLDVEEISEESDLYRKYYKQAEEALEIEDSEEPVSGARFFSIRFQVNGKTIQPAAPVDVKVRFDDKIHRDLHPMQFSGKHNVEMVSGQVNTKKQSVSFRADRSSVYGIVDTTIENYLLTKDGHRCKVTVSYDSLAGIPKDVELSLQELEESSKEYDTYLEQSEDILGCRKGSVGYARLFDISIVDRHDHSISYQPAAPVKVEISLEDGKDASWLNVVHFGKKTEILENNYQSDSLNFETDSFSVYAILETPKDIVEPGLNVVSSLEEIARLGKKGFYVSHPDGYYFTASPYSISSSRTGIKKSKPAAASPKEASGSIKYYFEQVSGKDNQFLVYCMDGENKNYVRQSGNSLSLAGQSQGTIFTISLFPNQTNTFRVAGTGGYYWNMQGGANGNGFAAYNSATDVNARIQLSYYDEAEKDPFDLDGKSCGVAWYDADITGTAMKSDAMSGNKRLAGEDLLVRPDVLNRKGYLLVAKDRDINEWTFTWISDKEYYISTETKEGTRYLTLEKDKLHLLESPNQVYSRITVIPNTESGTYLFKVGEYYLNLVNGQTASGFESRKGFSKYSGMYLVEKSDTLSDDDFAVCTAHKISVSDTVNLSDGKQVILYTRIWNEGAKRYEFYAVDHDGSLIRCFESGDVIQWVSSKVNTALWDFTEYFYEDGVTPSFYYELQNAYSGKFIAPQLKGSQILSDRKIGINLNGRRYGDDYTTIIAWDDPYYEYAGVRAQDGHITSCPLAEADDFYFAVMNKAPEDQLTTVKTIDNEDYGITMKMIDFNNPLKSQRDSLQTEILGHDSNAAGLVSTNLVNGYPMTDPVKTGTGKSQPLSKLFDPSGMKLVNHLFIESAYHESGYFTYDSTQNFASLGKDGNFTVYDQLAAIGNPTRPTRTHGQFMPYNKLNPGVYASVTNQTDVLANPLSDLDPRKGEKLYMIREDEADYFFGMEMNAAFTQTASGLDAWGHDIIFEFSGDDDFWLYVDGELVMDLGGVHQAMVGNINFRTGQITRSLREKETGGNQTTLRDVFESNYRTRNPKASEGEVQSWLAEIFTQNENGQYVFKDYSTHTMKMFYMERGAGASNLKMRFNLAAVKPGTVVLSKSISGTDKPDYKLAEFPYQIWYRTKDDPRYRLLNEKENDEYLVTYTGKNTPVKYAENYTPPSGKKAYQNCFFLKPGQSAVIRFPDKTTDYYITECGINPEIYDQVKANKETLTGEDSDKDGRSDYAITAATVENRPQVDYENHVSPGALRTLTITKKLFAEDGKTLLDRKADPTVFQFRLYLGSENDQELPAAYMHDYYVKDENMNYCRWDPEKETFLSLGKTELDDLTAAEKKSAVFTTSPNGGISRIPAGFSVEIRELLVGTKFRLEERKSEIPMGYTLIGYKRVEGSYIGDDSSGTIRDNSDPAIEVHNRRGWGLSVEKSWSDADYMESRDPIYFGVYIVDGSGKSLLLDKSLRQMKSGSNTLSWYFDQLESGKNFDQYQVMEVKLTDPQVDDEGNVTGFKEIQPLADGNQVTLGGRSKGKDFVKEGYTYTVHYDRGEAHGSSETIKNIRTDKVSNVRNGLLLKKVDGEGKPLSGAVFTLKDSKGEDLGAKTYTSDEEGMITLACLEKGEIYTLKETMTPMGYQSMLADDKMTICMDAEGQVTVNGKPDSTEAYTISQESQADMPEISIVNKPFTFDARKIDGESRQPLKDVAFRLHPEVFGLDGEPMKDYAPVMGCDRLVTDADGMIPKIDGGLKPGMYFLSEISTPEGYEALPEDIRFSISTTGKVTLESVDLCLWLNKEEKDGTIHYGLVISNMRKRTVQIVKKGSDTQDTLAGATFALYNKEKMEKGQPKKDAEPDVSGTTEENGIVELGSLAPGTYYLVEEKAPKGYETLDDPVVLNVEAGRFTASYHDTPLIVDDIQPGLRRITVYNHSGYELPKSGGPGTGLFYICGLLLLLGAAILPLRFRLKIENGR